MIPVLGQLKRAAWRTFRKRKKGALILLYHRITSLDADPFHLAVSSEHFAQHLDVLQRYYHVLKLEDVLPGAQGMSVHDHPVVITFDDGYNDLLHFALPILKQYNMPATAFITSGYIGADREPWWDELEKACLGKETLPRTLDLKPGGRPFHWHRPYRLKPPILRRKDEIGWRRHVPFVRGWRMQLYHTLHEELKPLPTHEKDALLEEILVWANVSRAARHTHRMLQEEELRALADDGTMEIGAHTVNHVSLASAPIDVQHNEISECKVVLEQIAGRAISTFAYPHGSSTDYTEQTTVLVKESGYRCACAAFEGIIRQGTGLFELPRFEVGDWDGATFARHLEDWWRK